MKCRHCSAELELTLIDLGNAPPSNAYLTESTPRVPEKWFPLRVLVCTECWLVQTEDYAGIKELFDAEYAYFSSFSITWLRHAEAYVAEMIERFELNTSSNVIEVAANDGYLLQYVKAKGIPCLGIEPTASTAAAACKKGITIIGEFFGPQLARKLVAQGKQADLMVANNVLAHVPDINSFVQGFTQLLKPQGVVTFEFPHLMRLVGQTQFDTIYHEHFSYLSLTAVKRIFDFNGLQIFDVQEIPTHGGSLRVFAQRKDEGKHNTTAKVEILITREVAVGMRTEQYYTDFQKRANDIKHELIKFLMESKRQGKNVVAYGAAAKGNTLLNYAGVRSDLLSFVVDRNPAKQGKFLPGTRIPIVDEARLHKEHPDYVVILPWNLKAEITEQLAYIRKWDGKFVTFVPILSVD
ncbi:MAG: class I SAM-dependent methyltransferase [Nitrosomonadaceae bacterium]